MFELTARRGLSLAWITRLVHDSLIGDGNYSWEAAISHISREEAGPKIEVESSLLVSIEEINHIYGGKNRTAWIPGWG
jgi:hypothetical protein